MDINSDIDEVTYKIRGCIFNVYNSLGPGLLEGAYEMALMAELQYAGLKAVNQVPLKVIYKGVDLGVCYRMDIVVDDCVIVELKSVETLLPIHFKQLQTYLKLTGRKVGLLVNFNVKSISEGIRSVVNRY